MKKGLIFSSLAAFVILILLASCGSSDKKQIEELLSKRKEAFETKNTELYLSCISPSYSEEKNSQNIGIEEITNRFMQNVTPFDRIEISYSDRSIYQRGNKAEVAQKAAVEVSIEKDKGRFLIDERLGLEKVGDKWLIVKEPEADFLFLFLTVYAKGGFRSYR
jgi:hypothetical protein